MPPLSSCSRPSLPRLVVYYQTHHYLDEKPRSILPLLDRPNISITHVILAAIHLNDPPGNITLNDHEPSHPRFDTLWKEIHTLQVNGIKVLGMLGGAAKGSFARLDHDETTFELYYTPLKNMVHEKKLDGLDLDIEEEMTLGGVIRFIERLKSDFGNDFLVTLSPVASAFMTDEKKFNLSGFSYEALEVMKCKQISWYNLQFYCGWGDISNTNGIDIIIARGFPPQKIVVGTITNPEHGKGWVPLNKLRVVLHTLKFKYPDLGGVAGWEYFNSFPGDQERPWEWAEFMTSCIRKKLGSTDSAQVTALTQRPHQSFHNLNNLPGSIEAPLPNTFEYFSDSDEV